MIEAAKVLSVLCGCLMVLAVMLGFLEEEPKIITGGFAGVALMVGVFAGGAWVLTEWL